MTRAARPLACAAAFVALGVLAPRAARGDRELARFAIVIGNNRSDVPGTPSLRYADDDAVATHRLLIEAGVDSVLLVRLDDDSRAFQGAVAPWGAPGQAQLEAAFAALSARIRDRAARGVETELLFFYSGHGDVDRGEGYVTLEDGRLTRSMLYDLLRRSPAGRNHVFVDACKSYFLVFDRGPGGSRAPYHGPFGQSGVPAHLVETGFVLSTSSSRDSHEWERYQAGILSYELRSALRGAADANHDGRITYAELGGFIVTANARIANPRFRPDILVRPPGRDLGREVLRWPPGTAAVRLRPVPAGHVYLESARGERLLDAHPSGPPLALHLSTERPLFVRSNDETAERVVTDAQPVEVASLEPGRPEIGRRGALHLAFEQLFALPFAAENVRAFEEDFAAATKLADREEAGGRTARRRRAVGVVAGSTAIAAAAVGVTLSGLALEQYLTGAGAPQTELPRINRRVHALNVASLVAYSVAAAAGVTWGWTKLWPGADLVAAPVDGRAGGDRGFIVGFGVGR